MDTLPAPAEPQNPTSDQLGSATHKIWAFTNFDEDFDKIWQMWQIIFPKWPIERERLQKVFQHIPGHHFLHQQGFCLSWIKEGPSGKIAAIGVLPEYRRKGIGTALLERTKDGLREAAIEKGLGELKVLELGSSMPRFWPLLPIEFPQEVKDFFVHRGFLKSDSPTIRDFYKDIRTTIAPPDVMEGAAKSNIKFVPWSPEMYEECITKQNANGFTWVKGYQALAAYNQHDQVLVAIDPDTNEQIGWTMMCSHNAILCDGFVFLPLLPSKDKTGLIAAVGIDEKGRGKGIGLAMMVRALEIMKERGVEGVFIDSVVIRGFYEKLGFEIWWEYEGYILEAHK